MVEPPAGHGTAAAKALERRLEAYYFQHHVALLRIFRHWRGPGQIDPNLEAHIQDCYMNLLVTAGRGTVLPETEEGLHVYMLAMVRNRLVDQARRENRRIIVTEADLPLAGHDEANEASPELERKAGQRDVTYLARLPSADDAVRTAEAKQVIRDVLNRLDGDLALTIVLLCIHDKTPTEIGAFFGVNGYVRIRWAKTKLFALLDQMEKEGESFAGQLAKLCSRPGETHAKKRETRKTA